MKTRCNGSSMDAQGSETTASFNEQTDHSTSSTSTQEESVKSSKKLQVNVQCYGRGDVHEKIVKELNITQCEEPGVPCVLFVYKVSREIEDFRNALQWVKGGGRAQKEDICAVILLQKSQDVGEGKIKTYPGLFPEGTAVHRVIWRETRDIFRRRSADYQCPNMIRAIKRSLCDRTRSSKHSSPGSSMDAQGSETTASCNELPDDSTPSTSTQEESVKSSEKRQCNGSSVDDQGIETTASCNEQPDHSTPSTSTQEESVKSSEKRQCNVQCYGQGDIHEEIVKELDISQCEEPGVPCVLFVYEVSDENRDLQAPLQWVTGDGTVRKDDICSVILLQKSGNFRVNKMTADPGLFHEGTNVFQIFWTEASVTWTSSDEAHAMIQTVRRSLVNKTKSRGESCPGV